MQSHKAFKATMATSAEQTLPQALRVQQWGRSEGLSGQAAVHGQPLPPTLGRAFCPTLASPGNLCCCNRRPVCVILGSLEGASTNCCRLWIHHALKHRGIHSIQPSETNSNKTNSCCTTWWVPRQACLEKQTFLYQVRMKYFAKCISFFQIQTASG